MALHAPELLRELPAELLVFRGGTMLRRRGLHRGEVSREVVHLAVVKILRRRRHLRVRAVLLAEEEELPGDELRRLAGDAGYRRLGRIALRPMALGAGRGLLAPGFDVRGAHRANKNRG